MVCLAFPRPNDSLTLLADLCPHDAQQSLLRRIRRQNFWNMRRFDVPVLSLCRHAHQIRGPTQLVWHGLAARWTLDGHDWTLGWIQEYPEVCAFVKGVG